ncbi:MAG: 30S ribosomal protein S6 [Alphaproteobacteria bacterium]
MALYENVFIARQDISATAVEALSDRFTAIISENGGKVTKKESWGLRNLAYKIKKNRKGHYVLFNIDAPSPAVQEMERQMRINEDVLRFLTVRVEELEEGPSAVMQYRPGRDDRPPRRGDRHYGAPEPEEAEEPRPRKETSGRGDIGTEAGGGDGA